jgi:hypothetical protein
MVELYIDEGVHVEAFHAQLLLACVEVPHLESACVGL